eukprot:1186563-Prorocentrum_minimum.AAC.2
MLNFEKGYNAHAAYGLSKLCSVCFTYDLAERLKGEGIAVNCLDPGTIVSIPTYEPKRWRHLQIRLKFPQVFLDPDTIGISGSKTASALGRKRSTQDTCVSGDFHKKFTRSSQDALQLCVA